MAAIIVNVSKINSISDHLTFFILSKLPFKSLKRFSSVRKSWSWALLSKDSRFMSIYRNNLISKIHFNDDDSNDSNFILLQTPSTYPPINNNLFLLSNGSFDNRVQIDWPPSFQGIHIGIRIIDTCVNGILCLEEDRLGRQPQSLTLFNPTTEEFMVVPSSPLVPPSPLYPSLVDPMFQYFDVYFRTHGFGYDHISNNYKVIRYVYFRPATPPDFIPEDDMTDDFTEPEMPSDFWEIYSQRSNSWKKLDMMNFPKSHPMWGEPTYFNGMCHWWGCTVSDREQVIVSFNLSNNEYFTTLLPFHEQEEGTPSPSLSGYLVVWNGIITLISGVCCIGNLSFFHISILGELGVKESWIKLITLGPLGGFLNLIGFGKNSFIYFMKEDDEMLRFDLSTQLVEKIDFEGTSKLNRLVLLEN